MITNTANIRQNALSTVLKKKFKIRSRYVSDMFQIRLGYVSNMFRRKFTNIWIYSEHVYIYIDIYIDRLHQCESYIFFFFVCVLCQQALKVRLNWQNKPQKNTTSHPPSHQKPTQRVTRPQRRDTMDLTWSSMWDPCGLHMGLRVG